MLDRIAQRLWYEGRYPLLRMLLLPLSALFALMLAIRRWVYSAGLSKSVRVDRPVVVVGNLTVGGTGKTPLVLWIANECARRGVRAAIICRGYRGRTKSVPVEVSATSDPREVGDEAVLLAQRFDGLVIACADRVAAARLAVDRGAEIIVCDDGLQHYRLQRDCEIVVFDAARAWGNGHLLPAGPLREPVARARRAQLVVRTVRANAGHLHVPGPRNVDVRVRLDAAVSLATGERRSLASFRSLRVHAIAGIGNPSAFFSMLREHGLELDARALPDHAAITAADLEFGDRQPVLMTEKDAVKCRALQDSRLWSVPLQVDVESADQALLWEAIQPLVEPRRIDH
jgi:tetraacyldisaccharide 4'-kinase